MGKSECGMRKRQRTEDGGQRTEVRGQRTEVRGRRTEIGGQRKEVRDSRGQRTEDGGQRTEVRSQRSEVRGQRFRGSRVRGFKGSAPAMAAESRCKQRPLPSSHLLNLPPSVCWPPTFCLQSSDLCHLQFDTGKKGFIFTST